MLLRRTGLSAKRRPLRGGGSRGRAEAAIPRYHSSVLRAPRPRSEGRGRGREPGRVGVAPRGSEGRHVR